MSIIADVVQVVAAVVVASFTAAGYFVLKRYTDETQKLREAAQRQNESVLLPILMLVEGKNEAQTEILKVCNVGSGPAFNARIDPMKLTDERQQTFVLKKRMIAQNEDASVTNWSLLEFWNDLSSIDQNWEGRTTISYTSANGADYESEIVIRFKDHQILFASQRKIERRQSV